MAAELPIHAVQPEAGKCPVDHRQISRQKTAIKVDPSTLPIERDAKGVWHIRGFHEARSILRGTETRQAGFGARYLMDVKVLINLPILYLEGKDHLSQRRQTARFFTPKTVTTDYTEFIEALADNLIADLKRKRREDLDKMSLTLAAAVVSRVVGLTHNLMSGMEKRIEVFFQQTSTTSKLLEKLQGLVKQFQLFVFYLIDVRPSIQAHRRQPQEDVISHLIENKYSDLEILTECVTYAAAGMTTTREFIGVTAWHFLENPELRAEYLAADEEKRYEILHEMLRLEPVIAHLYRHAMADISVESGGKTYTIPKGEMIQLHLYNTNTDEHVIDGDPRELCPARPIHGDHIPPMLMSFGDGHHRCPGAYLAIKETDIFLQRLLAIPTLRIEKQPTLGWNEVAQSYEIRDFILTVE
ncbi:MAG: cytochrome P450 [Chloroflexi bacterium]|nr:cytochrome P450 [Chloroflexota bacterium]MCC6892383.1 cytochrome P450 [Anaerolineae bacterium]